MSSQAVNNREMIEPDPEWNRYYLIIQGTALYLVSILISGYRVFSGNQTVQIPLILSIKNPSLFPGDPFVSSLSFYIAPVYRLVAGVSNSIPLESLLLILFLITRALVIFAAARLALTLSGGSRLAAVGGMAFIALIPTPPVGHGTLVADYFEHTGLSVAFLVLAIAAFYSRRLYFWAVLLAVGFNLNVMYGTYACVYLAAAFILDSQYRSSWREWVLPGLLFLILAAPTTAGTLVSLQSETANRELWLKVSEVRMPYHFYPLTWERYRFNLYFALAFLSTMVLYLVRKQKRQLYQHGLIWLGVSLFWLAFAFAAAYVFKSPGMIAMQPARGTDLWFLFAVISVAAAFTHLIKYEENSRKLYVVLFFIGILWVVYFEFALLLELILMLLSIGVIYHISWNYIFKQGNRRRLANLVALVVLLVGLFSLSKRYFIDRVISLVRYPGTQIVEIAEWAKSNTSIADTFLIDPNWDEFRVLSERPVFVTWKDGSAIHWQRSFVEKWTPRIAVLGFDMTKTDLAGTPDGFQHLSRLYKNLTDEQVANLAQNYEVHYWVVSSDQPSDFPVVFESSGYKVLDLNPSSR